MACFTAGAVRDEPFEDAVNVSPGVALADFGQELPWGDLLADHVHADLGRGLDQVIERRPDSGKGLIEIRRDLGQVPPLAGWGEGRG